MKITGTVAVLVLAAVLAAVPALAAADLAEMVAKGCEKEISTWCKDVKPGEARVLACLYAHNDKLSNACETALYDASVQLEKAVNTLRYLVGECKGDLEKLCSSVTPGEGRLLDCLDRNKDKVSARCNKAFKELEKK